MQEQKRIILLSLVTGIVLMLAKFFAYFLTASNFVLTDAAESIVNVLASSFAFLAFTYPRNHVTKTTRTATAKWNISPFLSKAL